MSDPFKDLFDTEGLAVDPLAPSEVRRRGDRLRRRRNVAGVVAAVAAVALIAAPIALFAGGDSSSPSPAPSPTETVTPPSSGVTQIPDEFPLAAGFPEQSEIEDPVKGPGHDLADLKFRACGSPVPDAARADRLVASYTSAEDYRTRWLTTYSDGAAAQAALRGMLESWQGCLVEPEREDGYVTHREVREIPAGDEGWAVLERDTFDGAESAFGATTVLVRLGNAILIEDRAGHAGYPSGDGSESIQDVVASAAEVIGAMCLFSAAGCGETTHGLTAANLPTNDDVSWHEAADWRLVSTTPGEGTTPFNPCNLRTMDHLGARGVVRRDFVLFGHAGDVEGSYLTALVAEFDGAAQALGAYQLLSEWVERCEPHIRETLGADRYGVFGPEPVDTGAVGGEAQLYQSTYGPVPGDRAGDASYFLETGVAVVGNRVLIMTSRVIGQDYNFEVTPMQASLPRAVLRLG